MWFPARSCLFNLTSKSDMVSVGLARTEINPSTIIGAVVKKTVYISTFFLPAVSLQLPIDGPKVKLSIPFMASARPIIKYMLVGNVVVKRGGKIERVSDIERNSRNRTGRIETNDGMVRLVVA